MNACRAVSVHRKTEVDLCNALTAANESRHEAGREDPAKVEPPHRAMKGAPL